MTCKGCVNEYSKNQAWSSTAPHPCSGCSRNWVNAGDKYQPIKSPTEPVECPDCINWTPPIYDTANFCPKCGRKIIKPPDPEHKVACNYWGKPIGSSGCICNRPDPEPILCEHNRHKGFCNLCKPEPREKKDWYGAEKYEDSINYEIEKKELERCIYYHCNTHGYDMMPIKVRQALATAIRTWISERLPKERMKLAWDSDLEKRGCEARNECLKEVRERLGV